MVAGKETRDNSSGSKIVLGTECRRSIRQRIEYRMLNADESAGNRQEFRCTFT